MKLDSSLVGQRLKGLTREITWRETTNYAAAVGDANPRYLDDSLPGGIVAPPPFAVALTWPLMADIQQQLGGRLPAEVIPAMVHANEHLVFHRPVRPGDALAIGGEVAAVLPTGAGTLVTLKLTAESAGRPVFTEWAGAMFRGIECADAGRAIEGLPSVPDPGETGGPLWEAEIPIERQAPFVYDGCTDIVFPIHTSVAFARGVGLPDIILQGTATLALASREIVDREAGGDPGALGEIACRFTGTVIPGTSIRVQLLGRKESPDGTLLAFRVLNAEDQPALRFGYARLTKDSPA